MPERPRWRHAIRWTIYDLGHDQEALAEREKLAWDLLMEWGEARGLLVDPIYNGECFRSTWDHGRRETWALGFLGTPAPFSDLTPRLTGFGVQGEEVLEGKEEDAAAFLAATLAP
jgi:hypothetical protein